MSITIMIENNYSFIDANSPELIKLESYEADEQYPDGVTFKIYPFELNIANGNFACLWEALGLYTDDCYCGSIEAKLLISYLKQLNIKLVCREDEQDGNLYTQGIDLARASRYYWNLMQIAQEAAKRGEKVTWG